jgi:ER lumen protein retaining receptor
VAYVSRFLAFLTEPAYQPVLPYNYSILLVLAEIGVSSSIVHHIRYNESVKNSYNEADDVFPHWKCVVAPCFAIALLLNMLGSRDLIVFWLFSIFLETVAILPQLVMVQRVGECDDVTGVYIFLLGVYRPIQVFFFLDLAPILVFVQALIYIIFFGLIYKGNASLRHKKDDSQSPTPHEREEFLPLVETTAPTDAAIDL